MQQEISLRKKIIFIFITILIPFFIVGLLELFLRVLDYGQDTSLFTKTKIHNNEYHVLNPLIGARYFANGNIIPIQSTDYFQMPKPKGTYRIFCLGGSTAAGYPYWYNASFASFLHYRLQKIFPEKKIEIINLGMTAINSFIVLDMAREVVNYEPDLIIVYDGHNEFYGPLGVSSRSTIIGSRWMNLLYLQLLHSKTFLLLRDIYTGLLKFFNDENEPRNKEITMELLAKGQYIPYRSEIYNKVEQTFKANMDELQSICFTNKIPVILSTQVSNLQDQVPFVSIENPALDSSQKNVLQKHFEAGDAAGSEGKIETALNELLKVISIDSLYAAAHFGIARCYDILNQFRKARLEYIKARDLDQLRFRASSDFNRLILNMKYKSGIAVIDMEKIFESYSPDLSIGDKLILEHLHPNSFGQFLMAKGYASAMKNKGYLASLKEWEKRDTIPDSVLWKERKVTQLDEIIAKRRTQFITSNWPFVEKEIAVPGINQMDTLQVIAEKVVEQKLGWGNAHLAAIECYKKGKDYNNLEKEYKLMITLIPLEVKPYLNLGEFYFEQGKFKEAFETFINSLKIQPTKSAFQALGKIEEQIGNNEEANNYYKKAKNLK